MSHQQEEAQEHRQRMTATAIDVEGGAAQLRVPKNRNTTRRASIDAAIDFLEGQYTDGCAQTK